jgi:hypothetical protein
MFSFAFGQPDIIKEYQAADIAFWHGPCFDNSEDWDAEFDDKRSEVYRPIIPYGNYNPAKYSIYFGSTYRNGSSYYDLYSDCHYTNPYRLTNDLANSYWAPLANILVEAKHCGRKFMHKPNMFIYYLPDTLWCHIGSCPWYLFNGDGMDIGELLIDDGRYFRCLPLMDVPHMDCWAAIEFDPSDLTTTTSTTTTTT